MLTATVTVARLDPAQIPASVLGRVEQLQPTGTVVLGHRSGSVAAVAGSSGQLSSWAAHDLEIPVRWKASFQ